MLCLLRRLVAVVIDLLLVLGVSCFVHSLVTPGLRSFLCVIIPCIASSSTLQQGIHHHMHTSQLCVSMRLWPYSRGRMRQAGQQHQDRGT